MTGRWVPTRRGVAALAGFAALSLAAVVPFGAAYAAHLTRFAMMGANVTVESARLDGDWLRLELAIPNPGRRPARLFVGQLRGYTDVLLTDVTRTEVEDVTIRPGETARVNIRLPIAEGAREELQAALDAGELVVSGFLGFQVAQDSVRKRLRIEGVGGG